MKLDAKFEILHQDLFYSIASKISNAMCKINIRVDVRTK